jgi:hypothetical protein
MRIVVHYKINMDPSQFDRVQKQKQIQRLKGLMPAFNMNERYGKMPEGAALRALDKFEGRNPSTLPNYVKLVKRICTADFKDLYGDKTPTQEQVGHRIKFVRDFDVENQIAPSNKIFNECLAETLATVFKQTPELKVHVVDIIMRHYNFLLCNHDRTKVLSFSHELDIAWKHVGAEAPVINPTKNELALYTQEANRYIFLCIFKDKTVRLGKLALVYGQFIHQPLKLLLCAITSQPPQQDLYQSQEYVLSVIKRITPLPFLPPPIPDISSDYFVNELMRYANRFTFPLYVFGGLCVIEAFGIHKDDSVYKKLMVFCKMAQGMAKGDYGVKFPLPGPDEPLMLANYPTDQEENDYGITEDMTYKNPDSVVRIAAVQSLLSWRFNGNYGTIRQTANFGYRSLPGQYIQRNDHYLDRAILQGFTESYPSERQYYAMRYLTVYWRGFLPRRHGQRESMTHFWQTVRNDLLSGNQGGFGFHPLFYALSDQHDFVKSAAAEWDIISASSETRKKRTLQYNTFMLIAHLGHKYFGPYFQNAIERDIITEFKTFDVIVSKCGMTELTVMPTIEKLQMWLLNMTENLDEDLEYKTFHFEDTVKERGIEHLHSLFVAKANQSPSSGGGGVTGGGNTDGGASSGGDEGASGPKKPRRFKANGQVCSKCGKRKK